MSEPKLLVFSRTGSILFPSSVSWIGRLIDSVFYVNLNSLGHMEKAVGEKYQPKDSFEHLFNAIS